MFSPVVLSVVWRWYSRYYFVFTISTVCFLLYTKKCLTTLRSEHSQCKSTCDCCAVTDANKAWSCSGDNVWVWEAVKDIFFSLLRSRICFEFFRDSLCRIVEIIVLYLAAKKSLCVNKVAYCKTDLNPQSVYIKIDAYLL